MPRRLFVALAVLCLSACASAQEPERFLWKLDHLKGQVTRTVDIDIGPFGLALARWVMDKDDPDMAALRDTLKGCKAVHIRSYEFGSDFEYPRADIEALQSQLSGQGWTSLATVRDRKTKENVDVYIRLQREKVTGFVMLASEARGLTLVNVVGTVDLAAIQELRAHFGVPHRKPATDDESAGS
jgi:Domain of unknown function (DUF4252)